MKLRFGLACAVLIACGSKKDPTPDMGSAQPTTTAPTGSAAPAGTAVGKCSFTVTGDLAMTIEGIATKSPPNGKVMATADYWQTDDDLRSQIRILAGLDSKKSKDAVNAEVDEAMKKDPKLALLLINCGADQGTLIFGPGKDATYADVPFKPATYPIAVGTGKATELAVMINLRPPGARSHFSVAEPGTMTLTKFDLTGIAGTFTFKAASSKGQKVEIKGSFDYPCAGGACKSS